jgi:hypothetical protein
MARPRPRPTSNPVSHIDPSRYRLIADLTPGPLGHHDAFDPNLRPGQGLSLDLQPLGQAKSPLDKLHLLSAKDWEEIYAELEFKPLKGHISDKNVTEYVQRRSRVFGSTALYEQFAADSDKELQDNPVLRSLIEMGGKSQEEMRRQTVFYRWIRKAYIDEGINNVPALIKAGMSKTLQAALKDVKINYGKNFKVGGFNPRPQKNSAYQYVLGTISEHALGNAVDIEDASNPILSPAEWKFLEHFTGMKVDRSRSRWKANPEDLWKDIKKVNDLFVAKLLESVKKMEHELEWNKTKSAIDGGLQLQPLNPTGPSKPKEYHLTNKQLSLNKSTQELINRPAIDWILEGVPKLKQYQKGFFTLEWALVKELHAHDFIWGATFPNVDLHHFELERPVLGDFVPPSTGRARA